MSAALSAASSSTIVYVQFLIGGFVVFKEQLSCETGSCALFETFSEQGTLPGSGVYGLRAQVFSVDGLGDPGTCAGNSSFLFQFQIFPSPCPWDCDGSCDGNVNVNDLLALLGQWDVTSPVNCTGGACDFNGDGCVDVVDLLKLLAHYAPAGVGCP